MAVGIQVKSKGSDRTRRASGQRYSAGKLKGDSRTGGQVVTTGPDGGLDVGRKENENQFWSPGSQS